MEEIRYCTGVDLIECSVKAAMGDLIDIKSFGEPHGYYAYYAVHSNKNGVLDLIEINTDIENNNIIDKHIIRKPGDEIKAFTGANTTLGILLMKFDSMEQMLYLMDNSEEWINVKLK